ncbi:actin nucleation-promoting factor WASL-like [Vidua macroura]|uniref:actin nucleation-promoting factor WASL-like n=1 Tax=Vidua macroura TaxID=187451 RepID=UPI0023A88AC6|nr:actin nucleation-promoting factor WASL-like [Vidua macroura]
MFFIVVITFIAITVLLLIFHIIRKLCQDPVPPPAYRCPQGPAPAPPYRDPQGSVPPALTLVPTLPILPSAAIPVGLEPPPYSEVTAKPFLYPLPGGPCPECGHNPAAQPRFPTRT